MLCCFLQSSGKEKRRHDSALLKVKVQHHSGWEARDRTAWNGFTYLHFIIIYLSIYQDHSSSFSFLFSFRQVWIHFPSRKWTVKSTHPTGLWHVVQPAELFDIIWTPVGLILTWANNFRPSESKIRKDLGFFFLMNFNTNGSWLQLYSVNAWHTSIQPRWKNHCWTSYI